MLLSPLKEVVRHLQGLADTFGWKFIGLLWATYGASQGLGSGWLYLLQRYYFKDVLQLTAAKSQLLIAVCNIPWNIKVLTIALLKT
jgi:hypothetical protein